MSLLFCKVVDNTIRRSSGALPENTGGRNHSLRVGYKPRFGDAMYLFIHCWPKTKARTIVRFWMKSECPSYLQVQQCEQIRRDYRNENEENLPDAPIEQNETEQLYKDIFINSMLSQVQLQSDELLPDLGEVRSVDEFANILNHQKMQVWTAETLLLI